MKFEKINNKGQAQLFENKYLEMLTKGHPAVIWGMYIPILSYILYTGYSQYEFSIRLMIGLFIGAILFWTFFEYLAHRFLFHWATEHPKFQRLVYIFHGNHHHYPRDKQRLFMPPIPSLILATIIFSIQYFLLGKYVFVFFPGFMIGYLLYASMHYLIHAVAPPFKFMKPLWRNHHLHHYKNEELGFGVSNTFWDRVFGTMFDLNHEKEDKEKVKDLMFDKKQ
ncbi:sterol desaturase family protein [Faecalibacter bovis]|uniref:Sterol desaturase family protein n=1 Tax=Faecalibacter bovis TaxID=2898187 RepID=A0ABX7XAB9_9FLAO|nr:sterol desaturase family protein [Faecalibacter bovis]QTV04742.1 sterol desaturase family protein [Faecalibacter bovis]